MDANKLLFLRNVAFYLFINFINDFIKFEGFSIDPRRSCEINQACNCWVMENDVISHMAKKMRWNTSRRSRNCLTKWNNGHRYFSNGSCRVFHHTCRLVSALHSFCKYLHGKYRNEEMPMEWEAWKIAQNIYNMDGEGRKTREAKMWKKCEKKWCW